MSLIMDLIFYRLNAPVCSPLLSQFVTSENNTCKNKELNNTCSGHVLWNFLPSSLIGLRPLYQDYRSDLANNELMVFKVTNLYRKMHRPSRTGQTGILKQDNVIG